MPSPWQVRLALQVGAPAMQREYLRSLSAIAETASAAELRGCMERLVPYAPTPVLCEFARRSAMQAETPLVRAELARLLACCGDPLDEELFARPEIPSSTALIWHGARLARVDAQGVPPGPRPARRGLSLGRAARALERARGDRRGDRDPEPRAERGGDGCAPFARGRVRRRARVADRCASAASLVPRALGFRSVHASNGTRPAARPRRRHARAAHRDVASPTKGG